MTLGAGDTLDCRLATLRITHRRQGNAMSVDTMSRASVGAHVATDGATGRDDAAQPGMRHWFWWDGGGG
jgi:hypothetical protein